MYTRLRIQRELQDDQDRRMAHTRLQQNTILAEQALPTLSRRNKSGSLDPQMILHLQRQLGNKGVCRMLASRKATKTGARSIERTIQRDDDDPDEYEAMPAPNDVASTDNVPDDSYSSGGGDNSASVDDDGGNNYSVGDGNYAQSQSNGDDAYTSDDDDNGDYSEHVDNPGFSNSPEPDEAGETQETISIPDFQSEGSAVVTARGRIDRYIDDYGNDCDKYTGNKCSLQGLTTANFHWTKKAHDIIVEPAAGGGYNPFGVGDLDSTAVMTMT